MLFNKQSLRVTIHNETCNTELGTDSTFFMSSKGDSWVQLKMCVDPYIASFNSPHDLGGMPDVVRPDGCSQAVQGTVCLGNCFFIGAEAHDWDDRS